MTSDGNRKRRTSSASSRSNSNRRSSSARTSNKKNTSKKRTNEEYEFDYVRVLIYFGIFVLFAVMFLFSLGIVSSGNGSPQLVQLQLLSSLSKPQCGHFFTVISPNRNISTKIKQKKANPHCHLHAYFQI